MVKIFVIAGEDSGDRLGAELLVSLRNIYPEADIRGIGGERMRAAGLSESLFPMEELSVMGIVEILPRIPKFLRLIAKTVQAIKVFSPDVVVTIDSPDFSFRVQRRLRRAGLRARRVHYVAPTVWAWRAGRAEKIAQFLDGIICLYPFEPIYFEKEGLRASFAGHPVMQGPLVSPDRASFRLARNIPPSQKIIGFFCGSRRAELDVSVPLFKQCIRNIRLKYPDAICVLPTLEKWRVFLSDAFKEFPDVLVTADEAERHAAFCAPNAAVAVSGTVSLELAVASVPHVIVYRMGRLTWEIVRRVVHSKFAHLGNILLGHQVWPEFIQENATAESVTEAIVTLLENPIESKIQTESSRKLRFLLAPNPNEKAADVAAAFIRNCLTL